ncbi:transcription factor, putative [Bodo saltans]|uniref:General transcription factor IIH subunit 4 n=1 Tax=Bodo saltans TaxID=75058 RepID=A0A0S4JS94_BODSA|nr:transcription factor, putative [Bodo saltans]|eukprot:CUG94373.1 transcription factor, putative [Bodo saltans]
MSSATAVGASSSESVSVLWDFLVNDPRRSEAIAECPALAVTVVQLMLTPSSQQRWWEHQSLLTQTIRQHGYDEPTTLDADPFGEVFLRSNSRGEALGKLAALCVPQESATTATVALSFANSLLRAIQFILFGGAATHDVNRDELNAKDLIVVGPSASLPQWLPAPLGKAKIMEDTWVDAAFQAGRKKLKGICHMLLDNGSSVSTAAFGPRATAMIQLIQYAGLTSTTSMQLTGAGMGFCMAEATEQYATLLRGVIRIVAASTSAPVDDLLRHVAVLGQADTNRCALPFPTKAAQPTLHALLLRLIDIGVAYPIANSGEHYFVVTACFGLGLLVRGTPSPVMNRMMADHDATSSTSTTTAVRSIRSEDEDTIITETNFRLYAYTRNPTLLRVLDQFTERDTIVDDWLVCCKLTRDAFVGAVRRGISAQQVLEFLSLKAHPVMRRRAVTTNSVEVVPQSIADQLRMWEADCKRVGLIRDTVLLSGLSATQRKRILEEIADRGHPSSEAVLYDDESHTLVVSSMVYDTVLHPLLTGESAAPML